jgi:4-amino-4-deoxy-L-arabinose transferase-like glycosyltransferase
MTSSSAATPRPVARVAGVVALLALYYVMALTAAGQKSMTFDEMAHLTGGYTYWAFDDYRLHPENGNWPQRLAALPAVMSGAGFPALNQPAWTTSNLYVMGDQYLYFSGNDADTLLSRARAVMTLVGVALGALVYAWSRRLVSPEAGWVSLVLFVFSPTFLAHGPLATSDMTAALYFTAAAGAIWAAMQRVTPARVLGAAVLVAGCVLSKLSGPILAPIAIIMLVVRVIDGRPLTVAFRGVAVEHGGRARQLAVLLGVLLVFALVAWALLWASYGFRYTAFSAATTGKDAFLGQVQDQPGIAGRVLSAARQHRLLPEAYIYASLITVQFASERAAFLNGQFATTGWWWYFPYAFSVKTTIPAMLMGVLALAALVVRWKDGRDGATGWARARTSLYAGTPLLALVGIYWLFALASNLNIGHRHLLPIYPALCMLAGGAAFWIRPLFPPAQADAPQTGRGRRARKTRAASQPASSAAVRALGVATLALLGWHVAESIAIRPSYLAYFNQLAGGPSQGYLHLADSSLDWGQDLPALKQWLDRAGLQPGGGNVYLSYFGTARPEYYGIQATPLAGFIDRRPPAPPVPLGGGVYCVSATMLDVVSRLFYKPEYEANYQAAVKNATVFAQASRDEQAMSSLMRNTGEEYWRQLFGDLDQLRTGRLLAFLRQRRPDALVGYSILIYRLTDADVVRALNDPLSASR